MKYILFLLPLLMLLACSKSDNVVSSNELVGTWRLIAYCKPVSSSTCTTIAMPAEKGVFISFDNDGTFNESYENTKPVEYAFLGCGGGAYKIEGSNVRITAICMSSMSGKLMQIVSVKNARLVLNPFGTGEYSFVRR